MAGPGIDIQPIQRYSKKAVNLKNIMNLLVKTGDFDIPGNQEGKNGDQNH
jgi:hypothetical protein